VHSRAIAEACPKTVRPKGRGKRLCPLNWSINPGTWGEYQGIWAKVRAGTLGPKKEGSQKGFFKSPGLRKESPCLIGNACHHQGGKVGIRISNMCKKDKRVLSKTSKDPMPALTIRRPWEVVTLREKKTGGRRTDRSRRSWGLPGGVKKMP